MSNISLPQASLPYPSPKIKKNDTVPNPGIPTITATPEVTIRTLDAEDEFVVIGCDGLWDTLSMQTVTNFIRGQLNMHRDMQYDDHSLLTSTPRTKSHSACS